MADLNLSPKFKYSTLLCCKVRDIFSIYIPNRARSVHENHQRLQGWNPTNKRIKSKKRYLIIRKNIIKTITSDNLP